MKNRWLAARALQFIMMAGCSTQAHIAATRSTEIALGNARNLAWVDCSGPAECERLWHRTELYVAQLSATPIRHVDDTRMETAVPHTLGTVYVRATPAALRRFESKACAAECIAPTAIPVGCTKRAPNRFVQLKRICARSSARHRKETM
ncbi:hypothetical protein QF025_006642 [Paraburkholderia graminis]|uniref:Lipoprotein n=1 Tax=Paraburkholderia graminis TaxID=60548 RepID=A0ABD5CU98_9BURK|nr:hypothetical protein [Paraburkholderia graminis]